MASQIQSAQHAWERGDYGQAQKLARAVLASETDDDSRKVAADILSRMRNDRAAVVLGLVGILFFILVFVSYAGRN